MAWPDRVDFRPGPLAEHMSRRMDELGVDGKPLTPSQYLRRLIAADCGVEVPEMRGNVQYLKQNQRQEPEADESE